MAGGPAPKAATTVAAASTPPPKHLDIFKGAPLRLPKPFSDEFHVRVCSLASFLYHKPSVKCFVISCVSQPSAVVCEGLPHDLMLASD